MRRLEMIFRLLLRSLRGTASATLSSVSERDVFVGAERHRPFDKRRGANPRVKAASSRSRSTSSKRGLCLALNCYRRDGAICCRRASRPLIISILSLAYRQGCLRRVSPSLSARPVHAEAARLFGGSITIFNQLLHNVISHYGAAERKCARPICVKSEWRLTGDCCAPAPRNWRPVSNGRTMI